MFAVLAVASGAAPAQDLPPLPGLDPGDAGRRSVVDAARVPWNALARVQTELGGRCTGFLLAPRVVETAAHCLFLPKVGRFIRPEEVHVLLGLDRGQYAAHARTAQYRIAAGYDPRREADTVRFDRAVLVLDRPVAGEGTTVPVAAATPPAGTALMLGGYDQDRPERVLADTGCRLLGVENGTIRHDCAGTRGTSGAPLLARGADGRWAAIGVQVAARVGTRGGVAAALSP